MAPALQFTNILVFDWLVPEETVEMVPIIDYSTIVLLMEEISK